MKKLLNIIPLAALSGLFAACEVERAPVIILPDVELEYSGLTTVLTITSYENDTYVVTLERTQGLSKPAEFDISVDRTVLDDYNDLNESDYLLMPASLYTIGATDIRFGEAEKTASFEIYFKPGAILSEAGSVAEAQKMVIPLKCIPRSSVDVVESRLSALIHFDFVDPAITTETAGEKQFSFVTVSNVPRVLTLEATTNFNQIDLADLGYQTGQHYVDAYNDANGTDYLLVPSECYTWSEFVFDSEAYHLQRDISVMCSQLDPDRVYILPLSLKSTKYNINEGAMVYIKATITDLEMVFANDHEDPERVLNFITNKPGSTTFKVSINAALDVDCPLEFSYSPARVDEYNTAKGTAFKALDSSLITIANSTITAGNTDTTVSVEFDLTNVPFEEGLYLVPLILDKSQLPYEPEDLAEVTYYVVRRSLVGFYSANYWSYSDQPFPENNNNNGAPDWGNAEWIKSEVYDVDYYKYTHPEKVAEIDAQNFNGKFKYFQCYWNVYDNTNAFMWYVDWDGSFNGDSARKPIYMYRTGGSGYPSDDTQWTTKYEGTRRQSSYYDMETGYLWMDVYYYWTYGDIVNYKPSDEENSGGSVYKTRYMGAPEYFWYSPDRAHDLPMDNWR